MIGEPCRTWISDITCKHPAHGTNSLGTLYFVDSAKIAISTTLFNLVNKVESLEDLDIQNALSALATAQADIIELKSKVSSLELTSFLILE